MATYTNNSQNTAKSIVGEDVAVGEGSPLNYLKAHFATQGLSDNPSQVAALQKQGYTPTYAPGSKDYDIDNWARSNPNLVNEYLGKVGLGTTSQKTALEGQAITPASQLPQNAAAIAQDKGQATPSTTPNMAQVNAPNATGASYNAATGALTLPKDWTPPNNFKTGQQNAVASGTPSPQDAGQAKATMGQFQPPNKNVAPPSTPAVQNFMQTDKTLAKQAQELKDLLSPPQVQKDISDAMSKLTGAQQVLAGEKLQLMNLNNVMAGTEQDLRDELSKGGGLVTDSQVKALAVARNQTLQKQASYLQNQLSYQQDLVSSDQTLLNFEKDMANTQFQQNSGIYKMLQDNQNNQLTAARDSIKTLLSQPGGLTAYANDPSQAAYAEKLYGWAPGTIANMATQATAKTTQDATKAALDLDLTRQQIKASQASEANSWASAKKTEAETDALNNPSSQSMISATTGKPLSPEEQKNFSFGQRMVQATNIAQKLDETFAKTPRFELFGLVPNKLKSEDRQSYEQAILNFVNAKLRQESGAAIGDPEYVKAEKQYFAQYGDTPATLEQKRQNRNLVIKNQLREGGQGDVDPSKLTVSPSGDLIMITD